ncbi:cytochrome P460 family protein [Xanthobacteraceae bacterium Astr-EGSB]|uniref:cytochrome P460 family protein n=1 Tax=Astrobacterium formosum TaxID=3069710 RepID=UPI0027B82413|nr:cytochrome P460 family protein [Xanthobacteraceae bacterium Astr-EGSB]
MKLGAETGGMQRLVLGLSGALFTVVVLLQLTAGAQDKPNTPISLPIDTVTLPDGYRDWKLISVAHEAGKNNDIRAILGNEIAVKAFRDGKRPFPEGTVIARLAWQYQSSPRNDAVFSAPQSFVAGPPTNVQLSVKDSKHFAASGGWGYGQFEGGRPNRDPALLQTCFACHAKLESRADFVFTHYSP